MFAVAVLAAVIAAVTALTMTSLGGASGTPSETTVADEVNALTTQAKAAFGDGGLVSASPNGSLLTVTLGNLPNSTTPTVGSFEAQVLAEAVSNWMAAHGLGPLTMIHYVDATGAPIDGNALYDSVGQLPNVAPLDSTACQSAAAAASSLQVVSATTIPLAGGTCVMKLQASDTASFAASAPGVLHDIKAALPNPGDYPILIEVDDASGNPLAISTWMPAIGGGGQSGLWIKPTLNTPLRPTP